MPSNEPQPWEEDFPHNSFDSSTDPQPLADPLHDFPNITPPMLQGGWTTSPSQWTYPEDEPPSTAEEDNKEDNKEGKTSGEELKETSPKPMPHCLGSKDHASSAEKLDTLPGNVTQGPR